MDAMRIITNNVPRDIIYAYELTDAERAEFDYLDWAAIDVGGAMTAFIRYRGQLYDLGEFQTTSGLPEFSPLRQWDGLLADSYFSGIVVRYCDGFERVVCGTFLA